MDPGIIIGTLAIFTIGTVLLVSIGHFGIFMRDPKNQFHVRNILADGPSATTVAMESDSSVPSIPLKARLDNSIASSHPADPEQVITKAQRVGAFNAGKSG